MRWSKHNTTNNVICHGNGSIGNFFIHLLLIGIRTAEPTKTKYVGPNFGLTVLLNSTTSDYYFSTGDHIGFYVNIFSGTEFPDNSNSGLSQMILEENRRAYFRVVPITVHSKPSIEKYSPKQRGCLFENEQEAQYAGYYSLADCLQKCKIQMVVSLCHCMPFFQPINFPGNIGSPIKCTLADNKCLTNLRCNQQNAIRNYISMHWIWLSIL